MLRGRGNRKQTHEGGKNMWNYSKKLQYPVKIRKPNPAIARLIITQLGGPDGELGASMRYLSQRYTMPYGEVKGILTDVGTEGSRWAGLSCVKAVHFFIEEGTEGSRWASETGVLSYSISVNFSP